MKPFRLNLDSCKVIVGNLDPGFVLLLAQPGFDIQAALGRCTSNEIYNDFMADQRPSSPILCYERKQPMLDLVPFAGPRRKVRYRHLQGRFVGQALYADLPQSGSRAIAAPAISQYQKLPCLLVGVTSHALPPTQDRIYGKIRGVMVGPDRHPSLVLCKVIDAIRDYLPQFLILKVMDSMSIPMKSATRYDPNGPPVPGQSGHLL